ncbi:ABC transporter permease [Aquibium sp. ELW1220]|uniref:ABC transporter permease n=1 Tax=Aquibium sp. ELW1220 TaxID=2976766 RepID=UPI0025B02628|nr:ABC transporter permease [Aquibium sp. ELW1220]MDN2580806.1 ABC transporter permease [Aquibium sp. ELW1220]
MTWAHKNLGLIAEAAGQHLTLSFLSVLIGCAIALVLGVISARRPRLYVTFLTIAGIIFVIPSLALFAFLIPIMGLGMKPALTGLSSYCVLILLRNVVTGLRNVPAEVLDAADGMGFSRWQRLIRIELPLALPLIVSGIRIALVTVIGIATIAAFIDAGGLGAIILQGIDQNWPEKIIVGGVLTALIAVFFDLLLTWIERRLQRWRQA